MAPKKIIGKVERKDNLSGNNWLVSVTFDEVVDFVPGQYVSIKVSDEGMRRSYSVASLPGKKNIDLLVDVSPMGVGSQFFLDLKLGDSVEVLGFLGRFTVNQDVLDNVSELIFVATGTGIAPFRPMIEDLLNNKNYTGDVRLIWGMRHEIDLYWLEQMEVLKERFKNFKFDLTISKPEEGWKGLVGRVEVVVDSIDLNWRDTGAFLCGSNEMIRTMEENLLGKGVLGANILYEKYY